MVSACIPERIFCTFAPLRSIRKISPLVSVLLALLLFAGNSGYTFIFHNCSECSVLEAKHSIDLASQGSCHLCNDLFSDNTGNDSRAPVMRHHCHNEIDRLETSELVKTDFQVGIAPFLTTARVTCLPPQVTEVKTTFSGAVNFRAAGRYLTTLHCQILS